MYAVTYKLGIFKSDLELAAFRTNFVHCELGCFEIVVKVFKIFALQTHSGFVSNGQHVMVCGELLSFPTQSLFGKI